MSALQCGELGTQHHHVRLLRPTGRKLADRSGRELTIDGSQNGVGNRIRSTRRLLNVGADLVLVHARYNSHDVVETAGRAHYEQFVDKPYAELHIKHDGRGTRLVLRRGCNERP